MSVTVRALRRGLSLNPLMWEGSHRGQLDIIPLPPPPAPLYLIETRHGHPISLGIYRITNKHGA